MYVNICNTRRYGQVLLSVLVVQDVVISIVLGIMPVFSATATATSSSVGWSVVGILARMMIFFICSLLIGKLISRYFLQTLLFRSANEQLHALAPIAICFGFLQVCY